MNKLKSLKMNSLIPLLFCCAVFNPGNTALGDLQGENSRMAGKLSKCSSLSIYVSQNCNHNDVNFECMIRLWKR